MTELPFVTVVIPCLNEREHIGVCLDSVVANDYPKDRLEIRIVDGMSEDGTRVILQNYAKRYSFIKIFDNPKKITPAALNIGIKSAKGEIIVRMDAHSTYKEDYIYKCIKYLGEYKADNVGGIWITVPGRDGLLAKSIALSLSSCFGAGNAHYRTGFIDKTKWVDTVPFGCFRKSIFEKIGFFNEALNRNEDIEFNARLRKAGGRILLVPDIVIRYYAKPDLKSYIAHNFNNGLKITYPVGDKTFLSYRHFVPFFFVLSLMAFPLISVMMRGVGDPSKSYYNLVFTAVVILYFTVSLFFSVRIAIREKDMRLFFLMPAVFLLLHIGYGAGSLYGIFKAMLPKAISLES